MAVPPAAAGEAPPGFRDERRVVERVKGAAEDQGRALQQQEVDGVTGAVQPRDTLGAVGIHERQQIVRGHGDRDGPQLRLVRDA